jgi:SAM-dependent methyltransferase
MKVNKSDDKSFNPKPIEILYNGMYFNRAGLLKYIKEFAPLLKGKILDFGCGSKPYERFFTNKTEYIGVDIENKGFEYEQNVVDVFYDGKVIPFENDTFDHVFSTEVFEHVFELEPSLKEINRVVKNNGYLLITLPFFWEEHAEPHDYCRYTSFGIKYLLKKHGFKIISDQKNGNYFTTLAQIKNTYYLNLFQGQNRLVRKLLLIIVLYNNLKGYALSKIFPLNKKVYLHNVILAQKNN